MIDGVDINFINFLQKCRGFKRKGTEGTSGNKSNQNIMKKLIIPALILSSLQLAAQSYMTAGGIRLGTDWGLTIQQRLAKSTTLEGIFQSSFQREEVMVTLLAEQHFPLVFRGLNIYVGGGAHKGWNSQPVTLENPDGVKDPIGLSLIGGAELTLGKLNISYDFKPAINLYGGDNRVYVQTGVSVRYVFLNNKVYKDIQKEKRKKERQKNGGFDWKEDWKIWKKKKD